METKEKIERFTTHFTEEVVTKTPVMVTNGIDGQRKRIPVRELLIFVANSYCGTKFTIKAASADHNAGC